jgi:hypothetical protein
MECLRLHNKPKAEVHPGHKLTGPKEEEEEATFDQGNVCVCRCRRVYMMIKEIQMPILIRALPITLK